MKPLLAMMALSFAWETSAVASNEQLQLHGLCTITEAPAQHVLLSEALSAADREVAIDLRGVEQADVTFVQLVAAAHITATGRQKGLIVTAWSDAAAAAFDRAGMPITTFVSPLPVQGS